MAGIPPWVQAVELMPPAKAGTVARETVTKGMVTRAMVTKGMVAREMVTKGTVAKADIAAPAICHIPLLLLCKMARLVWDRVLRPRGWCTAPLPPPYSDFLTIFLFI